MKVLVCGGRDFAATAFVFDVLDAQHAIFHFTHVIHGDARGADTLADAWALSRGVQPVRCPALWKLHGSLIAGPKRNEAMAALHPDLVIAFPGGKGTANMLRIAAAQGIKTLKATPD